jgi:hypothetical protein
MPPDQQKNKNYYQYGVFWLYNWFQTNNNNNMNIFFLMNGNILNYTLGVEPYSFNGYSANAIPPMSPGYASLFVQSYINAYNTAFNQETTTYNLNYQKSLYNYNRFTYGDVNAFFVPGTFGYDEEYNSLSQPRPFYIYYLQDDTNVYIGAPYLFVSAGSGGGSGYMYLNWVIVTYGVPYVASVS